MTKAEEIYHRFVNYECSEIGQGVEVSIIKAIDEALKEGRKSPIHSIMARDLADNDEFKKQLLKNWGFTKDGGIDVENQLKIFDVLDWIRENGNKQHLP